jgi:pimeloyl-ACP methyl ester carboxylesterase
MWLFTQVSFASIFRWRFFVVNNLEIMENIKKPSNFWFFTEGVRALIEHIQCLFFLRKYDYSKQGDGHPVLAVPGLLCTDFSMRLLRRFLNRLGYNALGWELGRNLGQMGDMKDINRLNVRVDEIYQKYNTKITLIGWSMGGIYVRELAKQRPELFDQVITLGAPFSDVMAPNNAKWVVEKLNDTSRVDPVWLAQIPVPAPIPTTAIYSKQDGIVPWAACLEQTVDAKYENIEVQSSHWAFGMNKAVLKILGEKMIKY